ncbi:MAG TPA: 1-acyl-sn-glycerol-3-phosphate acyltransferase [Polyangiales bacterium]|nr:1-acyl-sn-glycerol-3-phosphate acyltransferase [Polyangiales bacterium]
MTPLARELRRLSAVEMQSALGVERAPEALRRFIELPLLALSHGLGRTLANMDTAIGTHGLPDAARLALRDFRVGCQCHGEAPERGACLVLANHPGAYDALALMSALCRRDLLVLAADRSFLRALPRLSEHLVFVGEHPAERAAALKRAVASFKRGAAVLHFPAGRIEPDAAFEPDPERWLAPWQPGIRTLLRAAERHDAEVLVAGVRGVHSPRAKRFVINRWAEARGVTTLCPLLQIVGRLEDVSVRVQLARAASVEPERLRAQLRAALEAR